MRVATYYRNNDVRIEERPIPEISAGELLVKMNASGICGSDVMEWYRMKKAPVVLGHEITGEVIKMGGGVAGIRLGERVVVSHHVPCNTCRHCLSGNETVCDTLRITNVDPGGFAEYFRVPAINVKPGVFRLPEEISDDEGTFVEPLACVIRAQRISRMSPGKSVLVLGSGISGLLHIALAKALGAGRIMATDIHPYRLKAAKKFGADILFSADDVTPDKIREANDGRGADLVILCTAAESAMNASFFCAERGGSVLLFTSSKPGVVTPLPSWNLWKDCINLVSSYGAAPRDMQAAMDMIRFGRISVKEMITHRMGIGEAGMGFRLVAEANESIKVIIKPHA